MNLLLLSGSDVIQGEALVRGERAEHIRTVLKKTVGDSVKLGVVGEGRGTGEITADDGTGLTVRLGPIQPEPLPLTHLIVALPRPLAVSRLLHTAASFGVRHIDLIRAWKVPRSYFDSPRLLKERVQADLWLGAEQGAQIWVPTCHVHDGFRRFVEDDLTKSSFLAQPTSRFVLDPDAGAWFPPGLRSSAPKTLAFGPEGGFIPSELESFIEAGFAPVRLGNAVLTTEIAIAASLAQLSLLEELSQGNSESC